MIRKKDLLERIQRLEDEQISIKWVVNNQSNYINEEKLKNLCNDLKLKIERHNISWYTHLYYEEEHIKMFIPNKYSYGWFPIPNTDIEIYDRIKEHQDLIWLIVKNYITKSYQTKTKSSRKKKK